jgi:hypothetical protein
MQIAFLDDSTLERKAKGVKSKVEKVLMKCGHAANATCDGKPACAICACTEVADTIPDLTGRKARCGYYGTHCHSETPSSMKLPFFEYRPDKEYDTYYCGCYGWD